MRTTLSIDDDVLAAVHEQARREKRSAGQVLSDLAREVLTRRQPATQTRNGLPLLAPRGTVVTSKLINSIRDEIGE